MSRQSYKKSTFQIRIDRGWWKHLALLRIEHKTTFRALVEAALGEVYGLEITSERKDKKNGSK